MRKLLLLLAGLTMLATGTPSFADAVYDLNWANTNLATSGLTAAPYAQVTLHQIDSNSVLVTVAALGNNVFWHSGFPVDFAFNFSGTGTLAASSVTSGWETTLSSGSLHMDGAGIFEWGLAGVQRSNRGETSLSFILSDTNDLMIAQLVDPTTASKGNAFALDVSANGSTSGVTGIVAGGDPVSPVPEPASLALLGSGTISLAIFGRKRWGR